MDDFVKEVTQFARDINQNTNIFYNTYAEVEAAQQSEKLEIMVFVSTSMPAKSLTQWAKQVDDVKGTLVIRGFVNNSFKETIKVANTYFKDNVNGSFVIDPIEFQKYQINYVPAVVVRLGDEHQIVYGDMSLTAALEIIRDKNVGRISEVLQNG